MLLYLFPISQCCAKDIAKVGLAFSSLVRVCHNQVFHLHIAYASSLITLKFRQLLHLCLFAESKFNSVTVKLKHSLPFLKKSRCRSDSDKIHQICTCLRGTFYISNSSGMKINSTVTKIFNNNPHAECKTTFFTSNEILQYFIPVIAVTFKWDDMYK